MKTKSHYTNFKFLLSNILTKISPFHYHETAVKQVVNFHRCLKISAERRKTRKPLASSALNFRLRGTWFSMGFF